MEDREIEDLSASETWGVRGGNGQSEKSQELLSSQVAGWTWGRLEARKQEGDKQEMRGPEGGKSESSEQEVSRPEGGKLERGKQEIGEKERGEQEVIHCSKRVWEFVAQW